MSSLSGVTAVLIVAEKGRSLSASELDWNYTLL